MPTMAVEGRGRKEVDLTCGPHISVPGLTRVMVIWTFREPINKFGDLDVYFESLGTGRTPAAKFRGQRCILLGNRNARASGAGYAEYIVNIFVHMYYMHVSSS